MSAQTNAEVPFPQSSASAGGFGSDPKTVAVCDRAALTRPESARDEQSSRCEELEHRIFAAQHG